jgi:hypothetical protein
MNKNSMIKLQQQQYKKTLALNGHGPVDPEFQQYIGRALRSPYGNIPQEN